MQALVNKKWPGAPVASLRQLAANGFDDRTLTAAVRNGVLIRLRRGAYARQQEWNAAKPWERDRLLITAHYESTGGTSRYSHVSAARLHGCRVWKTPALVHVTTGYSNSTGSAGLDVRTHRLPLRKDELVSLWTPDGREILTTSLERMVLDCARVLPLDEAAVIGDHALQKGASMELMRLLLAESPTKRGSRRALDLLAALDGTAESAGETLQELGWAVFRIKWKDLDRPGELRHRLFAFLEMQKRPRPA